MSGSASQAVIQVGLKLDSRIPKEALISQQLLKLPKPRRQEWLRSLLVKGFYEECAEIRQLQAETHDSGSNKLVPSEHPKTIRIPAPLIEHSIRSPVSDEPHKVPRTPAPTPITALKAVVG